MAVFMLSGNSAQAVDHGHQLKVNA